MRIKLTSLMAGPLGILHPGYHEVSAQEGQALIDGGYATCVDAPAKKLPDESEIYAAPPSVTPESARLEHAPENTRRSNARARQRKS